LWRSRHCYAELQQRRLQARVNAQPLTELALSLRLSQSSHAQCTALRGMAQPEGGHPRPPTRLKARLQTGSYYVWAKRGDSCRWLWDVAEQHVRYPCV
jgi:hypothetical protein